VSHPKLVAALQAATEGRYGAVLGIAARARLAADAGRRCECPEPELTGEDLLCGACLLNNKNQERRKVTKLVQAHDFVPGKLGGRMCSVCTMPERAERHHGVAAIGRCSWGEEIRP
jgi:hypothetical protein